MRLVMFLYCIAIIILPCSSQAADLLLYSGAGLMKPMEQLRTGFENYRNVTVNVHYAGSGEIFGRLAMGQCCDVFIPGADRYVQIAANKGLVWKGSVRKLVKHVPVIAVPVDNPAQIQVLEDLGRPGVEVALGDVKACAIGGLGKKILQKNGLYEQVHKNTVVYGPTVNQLLLYVATGKVDATIIWEDLVSWTEGKGKVKVIRMPAEKNIIKTIPSAVTTCSENPELGSEFNAYISSEEGLSVWQEWGFEACPN